MFEPDEPEGHIGPVLQVCKDFFTLDQTAYLWIEGWKMFFYDVGRMDVFARIYYYIHL